MYYVCIFFVTDAILLSKILLLASPTSAVERVEGVGSHSDGNGSLAEEVNSRLTPLVSIV